MTKPWDEVKEEIVRLIQDGASLEQVRSALFKSRKFSASTRSYRTKLAQWKLTRHGQFEKLKDIETGTAVTESSSTTTGSALGDTISTISGSTRDNQLLSTLNLEDTPQTESVADDSALPDAGQDSPSPEAHPASPPRRTLIADRDFEQELDDAADAAASMQLRNDYKALVAANAKNGPEVYNELTRMEHQFQQKGSDKQNGTNTVLHYAASQDNFWVLDCILDFMLSKNLDVDATDKHGMTALERAIINGRKPNVESLLRANANLKRRSPNVGFPLHLAASSSSSPAAADICRVLLRHKAEVNACKHDIHDDSDHHTPLRIAVDRALSLRMSEEKDQIASMIEALLEHGGTLNKSDNVYNHDKDILNFLELWTRDGVPHHGDELSRGFYLGHYFRADCNPLSWFPARICSECHSMASYVFAHTKSELGTFLIKSTSMMEYGYQLAQRIIKPCKYRNTKIAGSLSELLRILLGSCLQLQDKPRWYDTLVNQILEDSPESERVPLTETVIEEVSETLQAEDICITDDRERTYNNLSHPDMKDDLRLQLSEVLLNPEVKLVQQQSYKDFMRLYLETCDSSTDPDHLVEAKDSTFREALILGLAPKRPLENPEIMMKCVIHVWTKSLLTDTSPEISRRERIEAFRLRDLYALPDMNMSTRILKSIWPFDKDLAPPSAQPNAPAQSNRQGISEHPDSLSIPQTNLSNVGRKRRPSSLSTRSRANSNRSMSSTGGISVVMQDITVDEAATKDNEVHEEHQQTDGTT